MAVFRRSTTSSRAFFVGSPRDDDASAEASPSVADSSSTNNPHLFKTAILSRSAGLSLEARLINRCFCFCVLRCRLRAVDAIFFMIWATLFASSICASKSICGFELAFGRPGFRLAEA